MKEKCEVVNCVFYESIYVDYEQAQKDVAEHKETAYSFISRLPKGSIKAGDWVAVNTRNGLRVALVLDVTDELPEQLSSATVVKDVIGKIECEFYIECKHREERKKALKKKMDNRVKKLQAKELYRIMAENDDELKQLLAEYEGLE